MRIPFTTDDGRRTRAPPEAQLYDVKNEPFVWIRTTDGDITRARPVGDA